MKKYFTIIKNRFQISLQYRFDLFGAILIELIIVASFIILWNFVYSQKAEIGGLNFDQIIVYFLFAPLIGSITGTNLSKTFGMHIKDGFISVQLLKPFKVWLGYVFEDMGKKYYQIVAVIILYIGVYIYLRTFQDFSFTIGQVGFAALFGFLGYFLALDLEILLAFSAFWVDDVWAFGHVKRFVTWILGGVGFPFEILSKNLLTFFNLLPFRYLYYVPLAYLIGSRGRENVLYDLITYVVWFIVFSFLAFVFWKKGIVKYGAYGN